MEDQVRPDPQALLTGALKYASWGWPVFPLAPHQKQPLYANPHPHGTPERATCRGECGRWGHGLHDATTDPDVIRNWWGRTPAANIGIATGAPGPDVLDVDVKHGAPGLQALAALQRTPLLDGCGAELRTPSGGLHFYFLGSADQGNGRLPRHGLDFRSNGGYVAAPPSVVDGRPYTVEQQHPGSWGAVSWQAIRNHLLPPPLIPRARHRREPETTAGLLRWFEGQEEGNRNSALHWVACRLADRGAPEDDFHTLRAIGLQLGLKPPEVDATIGSARRTAAAYH